MSFERLILEAARFVFNMGQAYALTKSKKERYGIFDRCCRNENNFQTYFGFVQCKKCLRLFN